MADSVRELYDRYPYPPPVDSLESYRVLWQDPQRRRGDYHLFWPGRAYREDFTILVAGCGTSQAAKHAMRWPRAQVIGIDLSATSVQSTDALKRKYNLANLHIYQIPIDRVSELNMTFDQIVCTGVLHHLPDPDAGLANLHSVLNSDGAMHLMLYAPYGRAGIYMLQEFCRRLGIRASDEGIQELIATLKTLPPGHPIETVLREAPDFRHPNALTDALLHPQDRAYSVPQLFEFLQHGRMKFGRWIRQAPYSAHCGVLMQIPQSQRLLTLEEPDQFAIAELFRGTMLRHSFTAYRDGAEKNSGQVSFVGDRWLRYVPIRMPDTICVEQRLPAGAAGVLINRTHNNTDLILPVNSSEKRLVDAIDGVRNVEQILEAALPSMRRESQLQLACSLFQQLWWHDQLVFDTSRAD